MPLLSFFPTAIRFLFNSRHLALENLALRQQLVVLHRKTPKPKLRWGDRLFWIILFRFWSSWRDHLVLVKPETVIRWHRQGFQYYWRWKSKGRPGRPKIPRQVIELIHRMCKENRTWGAPRIQAELVLLGHDLAESTVAHYMIRHRNSLPSQTWKTFLHNHLNCTAACDFFVVPTATFKLLYGFVVLSLDRRRILHFNVTAHPTSEWTAQQLVEAFPGDEFTPNYLIRDRDSIYGATFPRKANILGIEEVITAYKSPWQNGYCERSIGSIRRECLDHMIILSENHLRRTLKEYMAYYNAHRTHLALDGDSPLGREVETPDLGRVISIPHLGGLHHRYTRAA